MASFVGPGSAGRFARLAQPNQHMEAITSERSAELGDGAEWKLLWHREPPLPVSNAVIIFQGAERQFYRVKAGR